MGRSILIAVIVGAVAGTVLGLLWGPRAGAGAGILVSLIGVVVAVLARNQKDLRDLQSGIAPEEVDRALDDERR